MQWLKEIRLSQRRTQKDIAAAVGISDAFYSMIEKGKRRPSPEVAKRIAAALDFSSEWYKLLE